MCRSACADLIVAAHQAVTREWWERRRLDFTLFVSELVLDEASGGDPDAAAQRLAVVDGIGASSDRQGN